MPATIPVNLYFFLLVIRYSHTADIWLHLTYKLYMKKISFILLYAIISNGLYAQMAIHYQRYIDSLEQAFHSAKKDSTKARLAFELINQWSYTDSIKTRHYLEKSKDLIGNNEFLIALYRFYHALYLFDTDPQASMREYLYAEEKLSQFHSREAYNFSPRSWRNYASLQQMMDDENGMMATLTNHAIPLAQKSGNKETEGELYALTGLVFMNKQIY